jgi:Domain of unknown function (DUF4202)
MSPRLAAAIHDIDLVNQDDPRRISADGEARAYEAVYAERMTARLGSLYPEASELLQIAARAQHVRRWEIPRTRYPEGRQGYEAWRRACRSHHVAVLSPILTRHGYAQDEIGRVARLIRKEGLKRDPESQALENVVAIVFLEHYFGEFLAKYARLPEAKLIDILAKTLRKMSAEGHRAALALPLPDELRGLIDKALVDLSA